MIIINEFEVKICSSENLRTLLNYNNDYDNYDEWIRIGQCCKSCCKEGLIPDQEGFNLWNEWSSRSMKYSNEEMSYRWNSFEGGNSGIGYLFQKFKKGGGKPWMLNKQTAKEDLIKDQNSLQTNNLIKPIQYKVIENKVLDIKNYDKTLKRWEELKTKSESQLEEISTNDKVLGMIFWSDEDNFRVFSSKEGKYNPEGWSMTKEEILSTDLPLEYIKINNYKSNEFKELAQEHLKSFRFMLLEFDEGFEGRTIPVEEQIKKIWEVENLRNVIRKITFSGGKSLHILVESGVNSLEEFKVVSKEFYKILKEVFKLEGIDGNCKNSDRSSRLSGFWRTLVDGSRIYQSLLYINTDKIGNVKEWIEQIRKKYEQISEEKVKLENYLRICEGGKGYLSRESEVSKLLDYHYKDRIVKTQNNQLLVWNGEFYEELNESSVFKEFVREIKGVLEEFDQQFNFKNITIKSGINSWINSLEGNSSKVKEVSEVDNSNYYVLKNGVFNVKEQSLEKYSKELILTSKLNFNYLEESTTEELEQTIKEKVYYWWRKIISWENFKKLMYLHITKVDYKKVKFILVLDGMTNTGKSSLNRILNTFTTGELISKSGIKNSNFMLSGVNERTKILEFEDSELKGGFNLIKQLIGNTTLGVENKHQNERMVKNNLFVKILSNLNKGSYPEFFHSESQYFADKMFEVMFVGKVDGQTKDLFIEMGGEEHLIEQYGDVITTFFLRTSGKFIDHPRRYLKDNFGVNLQEVYEKLIVYFIDKYFYKEKIKKKYRNSITISKVYKLFKEYLQHTGISFSEYGNQQFLNTLRNTGKIFDYEFKNKGEWKNNTLSKVYLYEIINQELYSIQERNFIEQEINELTVDDRVINVETGEFLEEEIQSPEVECYDEQLDVIQEDE